MTDAWLNTDHQFTPGEVIFSSDRCFTPWAYTTSHGQLLLRSPSGSDWLRRSHDTTIDILFKPVRVMKLRDRYTGLVIRTATPQETDQIRSASPATEFRADDRFLTLESEGVSDYVVSLAVGWREGAISSTAPSLFAGQPEPGAPGWTKHVLDGLDAGLDGRVATAQQLIQALADDDSPPVDRSQYRMVYAVMMRLDPTTTQPREPHIGCAGVFITQPEAEQARARLQPKTDGCWIQEVPIGI